MALRSKVTRACFSPLFNVSSYNLLIVVDVAKLVKKNNNNKDGAQRPALFPLNESISLTRKDGDILFVRLIR